MNIGILGGTFDPIHKAHLDLARLARTELSLDKILLIPAGEPYFKRYRHVTSGNERFEMTSLAAKEENYFEACPIEIERRGPSYTADTLKELSERNPDDEFFFIQGYDTLRELETWHKPEEIFKYSVIAAVSRDGKDRELEELSEYLKDKYGARIKIISFNENISSTMIREMVKSGQDIKGLVPEKVREYIIKKGLYR